MRVLLAVLLVLLPIEVSAAGTFTGSGTATFNVSETLDGTTTTASKSGPVNFVLTTDYSTMSWSMNFNVSLVVAGGPTQSFETDLTASGSVSSTRMRYKFVLPNDTRTIAVDLSRCRWKIRGWKL